MISHTRAVLGLQDCDDVRVMLVQHTHHVPSVYIYFHARTRVSICMFYCFILHTLNAHFLRAQHNHHITSHVHMWAHICCCRACVRVFHLNSYSRTHTHWRKHAHTHGRSTHIDLLLLCVRRKRSGRRRVSAILSVAWGPPPFVPRDVCISGREYYILQQSANACARRTCMMLNGIMGVRLWGGGTTYTHAHTLWNELKLMLAEKHARTMAKMWTECVFVCVFICGVKNSLFPEWGATSAGEWERNTALYTPRDLLNFDANEVRLSAGRRGWRRRRYIYV